MKQTLLLILTLLTFGCSNSNSQSNRSENECQEEIRTSTNNNIKTKTLCTGWYYIQDTTTEFAYQLDKSSEIYYLSPIPIVVQNNIQMTEFFTTNSDKRVCLKIQFDKFGTKAWSDATEIATTKHLGLIINNKLIEAPLVNGQITEGVAAIMREEYRKSDIEEFKRLLDAK